MMDDTQHKTNPFALPADFMAGRPAVPTPFSEKQVSISEKEVTQDVMIQKFVFVFPQLVAIWSQLPFIRLPYLADVIPPWLVEQSQREEMWQQLDQTPYLKAMLMQRQKSQTFGSSTSDSARTF
jgi:hypothetical protein